MGVRWIAGRVSYDAWSPWNFYKSQLNLFPLDPTTWSSLQPNCSFQHQPLCRILLLIPPYFALWLSLSLSSLLDFVAVLHKWRLFQSEVASSGGSEYQFSYWTFDFSQRNNWFAQRSTCPPHLTTNLIKRSAQWEEPSLVRRHSLTWITRRTPTPWSHFIDLLCRESNSLSHSHSQPVRSLSINGNKLTTFDWWSWLSSALILRRHQKRQRRSPTSSQRQWTWLIQI